jgi:acyl carrier protein
VSAAETEAGLREIMADRLGIPADQIALDARLVEDLGLDSLDAVELAIAVERRFEIEVAEEELARLRTVADVVGLIESRHGSRDA